MTESTYNLGTLTNGALDLVGPKATNLARLGRMGLPVPPAGVVATTAYREHLSAPGPALALGIALHGGGPEALVGLRRSIVEQPLSADLARQLRRLHGALGGGPMAVRSSACAEDLAEKSFAGQHGTYFRSDLDGCLLAVRHCWASLWSDSAFAYREHAGVPHADVAMAVILQPLVAAECAGVVFTANPLTGATDRVVVESCFGLGEALVSGKVSPDRFVFSVPGLELIERTISRKDVEVLTGFDGRLYQWQAAPARASEPSLSEQTARELARHSLIAAEGFGHPVDVEWAIEDGRTYLLQARPITGLAASPSSAGRPPDDVAPLDPDLVRAAAARDSPVGDSEATVPPAEPVEYVGSPDTVWSNMNTGEVLPGVVTPATYSVILRVGDIILDRLFARLGVRFGDEPLFGRFAGRVYFNATAIARGFAAIPAFSRPDVNRLLGGMQGREGGHPPDDAPARPGGGARDTLRFLRGLPGFLLWSLAHGSGKAPAFASRLRAETASLVPSQLLVAEEEELAAALRVLDDSLDALTDVLAFAGVAMANYTNLQALCRRWFTEEGPTLPNRLVTGLGDLDSARTAVDLWGLSRLADADPALRAALLAAPPGSDPRKIAGDLPAPSEVFVEAWDAFVAEHGHHARGEIELYTVRWSEDPGYLHQLLSGYLRADARVDPAARQRANAAARVALAATLRKRLRDPVRRRLFDYVLRQAQQGSSARENLKSEAVRRLVGMRTVMQALGRRLVERGALTEPDEIFFLTLAEIQAISRGGSTGAAGVRNAASTITDAPAEARGRHVGLGSDIRSLIAERRAAFERDMLVEPPAVFVGYLSAEDLRPARKAGSQGTGTLRGLAVSSGVVEGPCRVIPTVTAVDHVLPGEILVAPFTDPGWAPFLLPAAGIIMDMGGLLSHGSIIAREYGVPAVVNVGPATSLIRTGQRVRVDGDRGIVTILD